LNRTTQQLRKLAEKKKRRKDMLHGLKVHGLPTKTDLLLFDAVDDIALAVYTREQMFPGIEMYSAEQVAAADGVIAAYTPEEREAALRAAHAQQDERDGRVG
jgi:hypothetical protein